MLPSFRALILVTLGAPAGTVGDKPESVLLPVLLLIVGARFEEDDVEGKGLLC